METDLICPPKQFKAWVESFQLTETLTQLLRTVSVWAHYCSPPVSDERSMAIAHADLALWFFYLDDYDKDDYEIFFNDCSRILDSRGAIAERSPLLRAYADVIKQVATYDCDLTHYLGGRRQSLELIRKRIRTGRRRGSKPTFNEYYNERMISVYVYQWLDMWEILGGFYLTPEERASFEIKEAKRSVTAWHILQNDMRSLHRDIRCGSPNLLLLHAEESSDIDVTVSAVEKMFIDELDIFKRMSELAQRKMQSDRVRQYMGLLEICLTGGAKSFWEIKERYSREDVYRSLKLAVDPA